MSKRQAYTHTDPIKANEIAAHSVGVLREMRADVDVEPLRRRYGEWLAYAERMGVCHAIRDHMSMAKGQVEAEIKARRVVRDPTGEQP